MFAIAIRNERKLLLVMAGLPKNVGPATQAGGEFIKSIPGGRDLFARKGLIKLQPPPTSFQENEKGQVPAVRTRKRESLIASIRKPGSHVTDCHKTEWSCGKPRLMFKLLLLHSRSMKTQSRREASYSRLAVQIFSRERGEYLHGGRRK
jgi:hypothetical protein